MPPPNRLASETSLYLRQHANNPVDWYPWGAEALARAKELDRPIFLSIGYSACHWCHVMEHESFEDEATAAVLNEHFVCIKVDREERPDLDAIYMSALQVLSRDGGGWPLSVFLAPDLTPFFAGTYYPPDDRYAHHGKPGFRKLLAGILDAWQTRRDRITEVGRNVAAHLAHAADLHPGDTHLS
ncbi:MAG TPA: thioredoxin domain-containing protein, partial [Urbifossiella sp.]|nr:thioredoxin domain-containing protein [Urbifossiella sp.]